MENAPDKIKLSTVIQSSYKVGMSMVDEEYFIHSFKLTSVLRLRLEKRKYMNILYELYQFIEGCFKFGF